MSGRPEPPRFGDVLPSSVEFAGWPPLGAMHAEMVAGPVLLRMQGLDARCCDSAARWSARDPGQAGESAGMAQLDLDVLRSERPVYLTRAAGDRLRLLAWREDGGLAAVTHHAALLVDSTAERGLLLLGPQDDAELDRSLQNMLRVAVAWRLALSGAGLMLHASAVEDEGRSVVFVGPSCAGKSTAARLAAPRPVLADDVVLLVAPEGGVPWRVLSSPFFAEPDFKGRVTSGGAWPVAATCTLVHGRSASIRPLSRAAAAAAVIAHSPFLEVLEGCDAPLLLAEDFARRTPMLELTFERQSPYWDALAGGLGPTARGTCTQGLTR